MRCFRFFSSLAALLLATNLFAQDYPKGDFAVGWSLLRDFDIDETFVTGFNVGGAVNVTRWLGIAGDFGYNKKSFTEDLLDTSLDLSVTTFAGGPRFNGRSDSVTGFGHILFGGARFSAGGEILGFSGSESETQFLIQPGGGLDISVGESLAIRFQGDYLFVSDSDGEIRIVAGVVFRF